MKSFEPKFGGHPARLDDLRLMQSAYFDGFKAFASLFDTSLNIILSGANITIGSGTVTCTAGYACWQGEVFEVEATSFAEVSGNLYFKLIKTVVSPSPVQYKNLASENVHYEKTLRLVYFSSGDEGEYLNNFTRVNSLGVPAGVISDWFGNVNTEFDSTGLGINSMAGWAVCNGNTYGSVTSPDLRGIFVVMATNVPNSGAPVLNPAVGTYNVADTGGSKEVTLLKTNLPNYNLTVIDPGHKHLTATGWSIHSTNDGAGSSLSNSGSDAVDFDTKTNDGLEEKETGISVNSDGSDEAHENRPPYFALVKVIKL